MEVREGADGLSSRVRIALQLAGWTLVADPAQAVLSVVCAPTPVGIRTEHGLFRVLVVPRMRAKLTDSGFDRVVEPLPELLLETFHELIVRLAPGALHLQLCPGIVRAGARTEHVTKLEHGFLAQLIAANGAYVSKPEMLTGTWAFSGDPPTNRVARLGSCVRKKVRRLGYDIEGTTSGYRLRKVEKWLSR